MKHLFTLFLLLGSATFGLAGESPKAHPAYFPVAKDGERKDGVISKFEAEWYSKHLDAMGEPALFPPRQDATVYRLLILPTWGNPISVRAELASGACKLTACRLDGQGGAAPGKIAEKKEVLLAREETASLTKLLDALKLFEKPTRDKHQGTDGDQWILEGVAGGRYHILDRWCAGYQVEQRNLGPFLALSRFLIDHAQLTQRPRNRTRELLPTQ